MFLRLFYLLKPAIPRSVQVMLRKKRAKRIFHSQHPPFIKQVPSEVASLHEAKQVSVLLTHDVEGEDGLRNIDRILSLENEYGVKSTWNFVLEKYKGTEAKIEALQKAGHECGAHGLFHDGRLFRSYDEFRRRMDRIVLISEKNGLVGFRSPSLLRNEAMMNEIGYFSWDSSFPAWDPFQPQPGGCEKYRPFMLNLNTVELPVTLWQDFTLFFELDETSPRIWLHQAEELAKLGALINIIVHPDYFNNAVSDAYSIFLKSFLERTDVRFTLPSVLADEHRKKENEDKVLG